MVPVAALRATPLHPVHRALGAKLVNFSGWEMPIQYSGILEEHRAVRTAAGLFDVSHMGEIEVSGPEAGALVDFVTTNHARKLHAGQAQYSGLLYEHGGFVDDILVHKVREDHYFVCVNAGNQEKDYEHIRAHNRFDAEVTFASDRFAQLAVQGPKALATLQKLTQVDLSTIRSYWFCDNHVAGASARIARTGYTGEDGFEIYIPPGDAERVWNELLRAGSEFGIRPCGLGARNTLRLEAKLALYGHEIDASITPLEAGLEWIVKVDKGEFVGRDALLRRKEKGVTRRLAGFEMQDRGIARDGYEVHLDGSPAGWVTSGSPSPALNKNIGLCYLPSDGAQIGRIIQIMIRSRPAGAVVVPTPFYQRAR
ncbi:MAG: glycine cleavage system aminomethyltransferase GcvT [Acidobacteriia bacterium]|nr:glycine cleavage system aminomethyltransferase GcvT [Terriglobia bacterium]